MMMIRGNLVIDCGSAAASDGDDGCTDFVGEFVRRHCQDADSIDEGLHFCGDVGEVGGGGEDDAVCTHCLVPPLIHGVAVDAKGTAPSLRAREAHHAVVHTRR